MSVKNKFWSEFSWVVFFIFVFIFLKLCVIGLYLVPSNSMLPTVLPGDRVVANKLAYGLTIPFVQTPLFQWSIPNRGDIILFSFSDQDEIYIKRVIGLPGDYITFREGEVFINREPLSLEYLPQIHPLSPDLNLYKEQNAKLFNQPHLIYLAKDPARTFFESRRFLVPPGKLFVLGDNRDHSADSRVYGYVDMKNVYARASFVLFSTTGESILPNFRKERTLFNMSSF